MVRSNTLITAFGLLAVSSALPASTNLKTRWQECDVNTFYYYCYDGAIDGCFDHDPCINPPSKLSTREPTGCAAGTFFYTCYNGAINGCFSSDPCINPPKTTLTPTTSSTPTPTPSAVVGRTSKDQRSMYVVVPMNPNDKSQKVPYFQVQSGQMDINQVGVFSGIPAGAKNCQFGWHQGACGERDFTVKGNGLVSAVQLDNLDVSKGVSWSDVTKAKVISAEAGPDFSLWPLPEYGATDHGAWAVKCAETIYMKFETLKGADVQGSKDARNIYMEQDEKNGVYISYTL